MGRALRRRAVKTPASVAVMVCRLQARDSLTPPRRGTYAGGSFRMHVLPIRLPLAFTICAAITACTRLEPRPPTSDGREDLVLAADSEIVPGRVPARTTLAALLTPEHVHDADVAGIVASVSGVFDLRKLRAGQPWRFERTQDGCIRYLEYEIDPERFLRATVRAGQPHAFDAAVVPYDVRHLPTVVSAAIDEETPSLFAAMTAEGETPELPVALAGIFAGEVDFNTDLQPGDRFRLVVDKLFREGRFVRYGTVQAAELFNGGRTLVAVRYAPPGAAPSYYDAGGKSLKRFFLRSPLRFEPQVTSRFSLGRLHPVLHQMRAHLGVDYRAPAGAPVVAVASGVVTASGWSGGGGNRVSIRHASGYQSSYLHLSAIAAGIRAGAQVSQGQMIGRVGATGLATGPHLDYRLAKNGTFVNPLVEHRRMPPGAPIPSEHLDGFTAARDAVLARLAPHDSAVQGAASGRP
jgi:murein DD-endopeptidase MepM/ murein hydrolase activator NlpD